MDKYRLVEEKYIGAQGFIDDSKMTGDSRPDGSELDTESTVRITQQAKPRRCITTAMNMLVSEFSNDDVSISILCNANQLYEHVLIRQVETNM